VQRSDELGSSYSVWVTSCNVLMCHHRGVSPPFQQGIEVPEASRGAPRWTWAKLLKRVFDLDLAICPRCQRGTLRMIAAITHAQGIHKILRHLKRPPDPPPIAPARCAQAAFAWAAP
jgi:hypothetical protein